MAALPHSVGSHRYYKLLNLCLKHRHFLWAPNSHIGWPNKHVIRTPRSFFKVNVNMVSFVLFNDILVSLFPACGRIVLSLPCEVRCRSVTFFGLGNLSRSNLCQFRMKAFKEQGWFTMILCSAIDHRCSGAWGLQPATSLSVEQSPLPVLLVCTESEK